MKILVVEDDDVSMMVTSMSMSRELNAECVCISNTQQFYEYYTKHDFKDIDVFICDWMMPTAAGENLIFMAKEKNPNMLSILYTACDTDDFRKRLGIFKVDKVMTKNGYPKNVAEYIRCHT